MLKKALKALVRSFGFELVKRPKHTPVSDGKTLTFAPLRNSIRQGLEHLKVVGFDPDVVIDVGAADGTQPILQAFPNAFYHWIEPLEEFKPALEALRSRYKGQAYITAVGNETGTVTFHVHSDWVGSSMLREADGPEADGIPREVSISRLDELIDSPSGSIFLKVDVQGAELEVLEGAGALLDQCDAILLEVSLFKAQVVNPEFAEVIQYMLAKGFVVYDLLEGHNRPLDHALAQKDVLFVKQNGRFRQSHRWATDTQRRQYASQYKK